MNRCVCGSENCKHFNVMDGILVEKDPKKHYFKWESKNIEDFKDKIIEQNTRVYLEDGMY